MDFVTILGAAVILGIFVVIIVIAMKKTNEKLNEAISNLTEEEKDYLLHTEYQKAPDSDIAVYAPALVHSVKEKGNGAALYLIFCDTYFPNSDGDLSPADINISAAEYAEHPVKKGDKVFILLNGDKSAKVAWNVKAEA